MTQIRKQDFERRLQNVLTTRLSDESSVHQLEALLNDCSNQFARLTSSSDINFVLQTTPILLHTVTMILKKCLEKSDMIVQGAHLTVEKRHELLTLNKKLHHHMKEFLKSPKLFNFMSRSSETKLFCHQLLTVANNVGQTDVVVTLYCQKLIVKILTGGSNDDQSQMPSSSVSRLSYMKFDDDEDDDEFILQLYESIIEQLILCWQRDETKKIDETRERNFLKIFQVFCQMLQRLLPYPNLIERIDNYRNLIRGLIQIHVALETMYDKGNFQFEFFTSSILLQDVLLHLIQTSSKRFFNDLFNELSSIDQYHYASIVVLCRIIETFDHHQIHSSIDRLIGEIFHRLDRCSTQLIQPISLLLPDSFNKSQIELMNFYDMIYSLLLKFLQHHPTQVLLSLMTHLISMENSSIISISNQLASELILQSSYRYSSDDHCQDLFVLFLGELLRTDRHSILIQHFLTLPSIQSLKSRIYQNVICSDRFIHVYHLFSSTTETRKSLNISSIYPNRIDHLYSFVRLFHSDLTSTQQQHAFDTCLYALQQFLSSPFHTESNCEEFRQILRLLTILPSPQQQQQQDQWKSLLGQLTHLLILLDEQNAIDLRLEFLRLFSMHCSLLEENDAGRLLDYILTNSIDSATTHSIAFHLGCLDLLDAFREKSVRSSTINDLIIQLIVRYGNEHQCHPLLKTQLIKTFLGYIHQSHDPSIATRVKSQCALLRANIDELEKNKKSSTSVASKIDQISSRTFNVDRKIPMKFYRRLIEETQGDSSSSDEAMQED